MNRSVFSMIRGSGCSKSKLAEAADAEVGNSKEMKNGTPLWGEAHLQVNISKKHLRFGPSLEVTMSKNGTLLWREAHLQVKISKNTSGSDQVWKLRCRKMARCCGAKHICKGKCTKHLRLGAIFQVSISKNRTLLWREAHVQVKT